MRIPSLMVAAFAAVLMTAGCMTDDSMAKSGFNDNIDYRKVSLVHEQAQRSGHQIVWVHMPVKKYRRSRSEHVGIN